MAMRVLLDVSIAGIHGVCYSYSHVRAVGEWESDTHIVLSVKDKLPFLVQPIHVMPIPLAGQGLHPDVLATHAAWVKASKEIVGLMLMTMEPDI
ncbi:hypothetical protein Tco_1502212 [Tanacetum coccineum]